MIAYLVDSDQVIDFLKGKKSVVEKLIKIQPEGLGVSIISLAELYEGVYYSNNPESQIMGLNNFLKGTTILGIDNKIAQIFGNLRGDLRKKKNLIDNFDLLIAATCICLDLKLLTGNYKHFERIPDLKLDKS